MRRVLAAAALATLACLVLAGGARAAVGDYGLKSFEASLSSNQAGAHPDLVTSFELKREASGQLFASTREITVETPPGLLANPNSVEQCTEAELVTINVTDPASGSCPVDSQVGISEVTVFNEGGARTFFEPVYMMTPPVGVNPMLVSIDLPPLTAVTLAPLPRWAMIRRSGTSFASWRTIDSHERP